MFNPITLFRKYIKTVYYYVPPCPLCRSPVTGHFVKAGRDPVAEWQIDECLRHGELVIPVNEVGRNNCYCLTCGREWTGEVETKFLSLSEVEEEKEKRMTRDILNRRIEEERDLRKQDHSIFKPIKNFIGKL